ncbi:hypothetical protein CHKEEEPN_2669 [Methylorubrum podarium]|nr:hypothetical protein CHKEEEPN_2669 [Methylorubrum podarium]
MGVLDHHDGGVDHGADRDGDAAQAHDVGADSERPHAGEGHQDADRQHQDGHERAAHVQQEHDADERDDDALLDQRVAQGVDGRVDELRAVVDRQDLGAGRQAFRDLCELRLDALDDVECVGAEALQDDAAGDLALAVHLGDAAALVRPELDPGDVPEPQRRAAHGLEHDVLDIGDALQVTAPAHHELELGQLDRAPADVGVARPDGVPELVEADALRAQPVRVHDDVVLLHEPADARDLGHALRARGPEPDDPILQRPKLGERPFLRDDDVLVDPAHTGRVGSEGRRHADRQAARRTVEELQHARARPVRVGAVLEDDVDEGHPEEREAAHHLRLRNRQHGGREGEGDDVLDGRRTLPGVFGVDDGLHVREVGDGVERQGLERQDAGRHREHGPDQHQDEVAGRPADQAGDHGVPPALAACWSSLGAVMPCSAAFRLLSASIRKFAAVTTRSPAVTPSRIST